MLQKLKFMRIKYNYSCNFLAKELGISQTFYWQIEKGTRSLSYVMAKKIAIIFNTKPDDLFFDDFPLKKENK